MKQNMPVTSITTGPGFGTRIAVLFAISVLLMNGQIESAAAQPPLGTGQGEHQDIFQLISRLKSTIDEASPGAPDTGDASPRPIHGGLSIPGNSAGAQAGNVESIQQKLELLRRMMSQKTPAQPENPVPTNPTPVTTPSDLRSLPEIAPFPMPDHLDPSTTTGPTDIDANPTSSADPSATLPRFQTIVASPVDSLELAGSLFATGNYPMALKTWKQINDRITDPHERQWLKYFVASSQRITGNREEAEAGYRELAGTKQQGYPVTAAKKWLEWMEKRKQSQVAHDKIFSAIDTIQKELETNGK